MPMPAAPESVLALFPVLAVLTNTVLPVPFEPVLLGAAALFPRDEAPVFALLGAAAAGVASLVDLKLIGRLRPFVPPGVSGKLPEWPGRRFYVWAAVIAASPLPFLIVRLAAVRRTPRALPFAIAVALGRFPRFLATVLFWQALALPPWVLAAGLALSLLLPAMAPAADRRTA